MIDRKQIILFCLTVCVIPICFFSAFAQEVSPSPQMEGIDGTGAVLSLTVSPSVVQPGGQVTVAFSGIPGNEKDWIGIYAQDTSDRDYGVWKYCDGKKEGSLIFDAPTKEGTYEFRVFESDTVHRIGKSDPFVVRKINISATNWTIKKNRGITIEIPGNWTMDESQDSSGWFQGESDNPDIAFGYFFQDQFDDQVLEMNVTEDQSIVISGIPFRFVRGQLKKQTVFIWLFFTRDPFEKGKKLGFLGGAQQSIWSDAEPIIRRIKDSIQITKSTGEPTTEIKPAAPSTLKLNKENYAPDEKMEVIFTAPASYPTNAWVGIIPSETPHGEESVNDKYDITYQYLEGKTSGTLGFVAPSQPGSYDVRMHDTDGNGKEVASITFTVATLQPTPDGEAEKRSQAMKLRSEGIALQKEGKYQEALEKYWESVKLRPDPELEVHIKKLEAYIEQVKTIVTPPPQPSPIYTPASSLTPEGDKSGLSASPDTLNPGKPITVTFSREGYGPQAWIGFFKAGDPDKSYREWSYLKDFKSDSFTVIAPKELGKYDFRIFQDAGYIQVAISNPVVVVQYQPVIKLLKLDVHPGEKISVTYGDPPIFQDAWIGFYQEGSPDNGYRSYSYLRDLKDSTYTVDAPKELGRYNFRMFLDAGYVPVGVSESVKVKQYQPSFTISQTEVDGVKKIVVRFFNPPIFQDAWIGFYQEGSPDNGYRSYSYLRDLKDSTYTVDAPKELGRYNFRMFLDAGYVPVGVSERVMISK